MRRTPWREYDAPAEAIVFIGKGADKPCKITADTSSPAAHSVVFTPFGAGWPVPPNSRRLELCQNLAGLRAPAQLFLGEDRLAVGDDLEDAPGGGNQTHRRHIVFLGLEDLFRHTDGMGEIPSTGAELDGDLLHLPHRRPPGVFYDLILVWRGGTVLSRAHP